jgi:hypothetical protein
MINNETVIDQFFFEEQNKDSCEDVEKSKKVNLHSEICFMIKYN